MKKTVILILIVVLWVCTCLAGDNIYIWTDKNGVRRFSDQPPPRDVKHYKTIETQPAQSQEKGTPSDSRQEQGSPGENSKGEIEQGGQESAQREATGTPEEKREAGSDMKARIEAERQRLIEKIDAINKRPLSRTYNQTFKQARIDEVQKQIDILNKSPEEYFKNQ